jgi:hypothetical protein
MAPIPPGSSLATTSAGTTLSLQVSSVDDLQRLARLFAASGLFGRGGNPDAQLAQCAVTLLAGMEAGCTPYQSITSIHIINGKPAFSAQLLAQAIKKHPRYDYRVVEKSATVCRIRFLENGEELGIETFTAEMAERAGLLKNPTWRSYPEAMLFARALTAGMRTHCPDALGGHTAYTPEELGASNADEHGMPVEAVRVRDADPRPMLTTVEDLTAGALRACEARGLTPAGLVAMVQELSNGEAIELAQLPRNYLARLAKNGVTAESAAKWNAAGEALTEPAEDPDDLPAAWTEAEPVTA